MRWSEKVQNGFVDFEHLSFEFHSNMFCFFLCSGHGGLFLEVMNVSLWWLMEWREPPSFSRYWLWATAAAWCVCLFRKTKRTSLLFRTSWKGNRSQIVAVFSVSLTGRLLIDKQTRQSTKTCPDGHQQSVVSLSYCVIRSWAFSNESDTSEMSWAVAKIIWDSLRFLFLREILRSKSGSSHEIFSAGESFWFTPRTINWFLRRIWRNGSWMGVRPQHSFGSEF